jgi:hypothetical protein
VTNLYYFLLKGLHIGFFWHDGTGNIFLRFMFYLLFEINTCFIYCIYQLLVCKISDHSLTPFFLNVQNWKAWYLTLFTHIELKQKHKNTIFNLFASVCMSFFLGTPADLCKKLKFYVFMVLDLSAVPLSLAKKFLFYCKHIIYKFNIDWKPSFGLLTTIRLTLVVIIIIIKMLLQQW